MKNLQKRQVLIRKLFKVIAKETVGLENLPKVKLSILNHFGRGTSYCRWNYKIVYNPKGKKIYLRQIAIGLNLSTIQNRIKPNAFDCYYEGRGLKVGKYTNYNKHNALRFILWHELRHAWQRLNNANSVTRYQREFDADRWAIAHLKTRKPAQTRPDKKVAEYIRLYKAGITTAKIALLCKIKDPRSIRYHLTKAGISLRRRTK